MSCFNFLQDSINMMIPSVTHCIAFPSFILNTQFKIWFYALQLVSQSALCYSAALVQYTGRSIYVRLYRYQAGHSQSPLSHKHPPQVTTQPQTHPPKVTGVVTYPDWETPPPKSCLIRTLFASTFFVHTLN